MIRCLMLVTAMSGILYSNSNYAESAVFVAASSLDFSHPHDLCVDSTGNYLFVADMNNNAIKILDSTSLKTLATFGSEELNSPHDVTFNRRGQLLVADSGNNRLVFYEINHLKARMVNTVSIGFRSPEGVTVDNTGSVFVANTGRHNVFQLMDNKLIKHIGAAGNRENDYIRPHDLEIWNSNLYITDPGNNRIKMLDMDLKTVQILGGPTYEFNEPKYLSLDHRGWLYVADQQNNKIKIFNNDHIFVSSIASYEIDGHRYALNQPEGVETMDDRIWVSDTYNDRILLFKWIE